MSISAVRNLIEKPGCAISAGVVMLAGLVITSFQCAGPGGGPNAGGNQKLVIATVGKQEITAEAVEGLLRQQMQQFAQMGPLPPGLEATFTAQTVQRAVEQAQRLEFAKSKGVTLDDAAAMKIVDDFLGEQIQVVRQQLIAQNKLKPTASETEFQEAFKKESQMTPQEMVDRQRQQIAELLKSPEQKDAVLSEIAMLAIQRQIRTTLNPTDEEVRTANDRKEFKRIFVRAADPANLDAAVGQVEKALAEIKAGTLTFERAMERYSTDQPERNKRISDSTTFFPVTDLRARPELAPLQNLKPNDVSTVVRLPDGAAAFKLIRVESNAPKNFEAEKAQLRTSYTNGLAASQVQREFDEFKKGLKVEWKIDGYRLLAEYSELSTNVSLGQNDRKAKLRELTEAAKAAQNSTDAGQVAGTRMANLVRFATFDELFGMSTPEEQKAMLDERIELYQQTLTTTESVDLRITLVEMFTQKKDSSGVFENLRAAAMANSANFEPMGESNHDRIEREISKATTAGLLDQTMRQEMRKLQDEWKQGKAERNRLEAEQKKLMEQERKQFEEEQKKAMEAEKKAAANPQRRQQPPAEAPKGN